MATPRARLQEAVWDYHRETGRSVHEIAELVGLQPIVFEAMLAGSFYPEPPVRMAMTAVFGVPADELLEVA